MRGYLSLDIAPIGKLQSINGLKTTETITMKTLLRKLTKRLANLSVVTNLKSLTQRDVRDAHLRDILQTRSLLDVDSKKL